MKKIVLIIIGIIVVLASISYYHFIFFERYGKEIPICTAEGHQWDPAIWGDRIVWMDDRNGNRDVYMYDLKTNKEIPICTAEEDQGHPAIWGDRIVWRDERNGNEDIYISASSGTVTINVATGATTPSVRSAGAVVNVVAGQVDFTFTVNPSIINYEYRIYLVTTLGSLVGAVELQGLETATTDSYTYTYTFTAADPIAVQIIAQPNNDYEEIINYFNLSPNNQSVTINLKADINN